MILEIFTQKLKCRHRRNIKILSDWKRKKKEKTQTKEERLKGVSKTEIKINILTFWSLYN
jgi:hypothetical protein